MGHDGSVSDNDKMPEPKVDPDVERAPGGADATVLESEPGAGSAGGAAEPVIPDQPLSAQTDESDVPDEIQESEGPDETIDDEPAEPEVRPTD
jgi:hypothetical protein